jgi:tRNA threonylcarbamoyladenosine biosynthesis protein TsaE
MELIFELKNISQAAKSFWEQSENRKIFAFNGEMGSGKTTFIHALCVEKKVAGRVGSPTFSIINEYGFGHGKIFHIDLYRVKDEEEAIRAGVEDCLYSGEICFVEWPGKARDIFPEETLNLYLEVVSEYVRKITPFPFINNPQFNFKL